MTRSALLFAAVLALASCGPLPLTAPVSESTVKEHVKAATMAAGIDLKPLLALCKPAPPMRPAGNIDAAIAAHIAEPAPPPAKAFDNLYFLGDAWVSAWALDTPDGIILFDALNNGKEAARLIEGGLRKLGVDPARIKYIVVTHGHGDHYGGVNYLVRRYHPHVVMSELDWKMMETGLEFQSSLWDPPPRRDMVARNGDTITLGGTEVTLYLTPGHTMGTISPSFEVKSPHQWHRVLLWGGTGFNFGRDFGRLDAYMNSTKRMRMFVAEQNIDVLISNHSAFDEAPKKLEELRAAPDKPNPFVMGVFSVERAMDVMGQCAHAQRDRFYLQK